MEKRFFWARAMVSNNGCPDIEVIHRKRHKSDRDEWVEMMTVGQDWAEPISAIHPEVRRIHRRNAQGEQITFPVEID